MKKLRFLLCCSILINNVSFSQTTTTTITYQNIPVWGTTPQGCLFNQPTPFQIGGLNHYAVSGGVFYTGTELRLPTTETGLGTAFGIYFPFKQGYSYTIVVEAIELTQNGGSVSRLNVALNTALTHTSTGCVPEPAVNYIKNGALTSYTSGVLSSISYSSYTAFNSFNITTSGINYLLIASDQYNNLGGGHLLGVRKITITESAPYCNLLAPTGLGTSNLNTRLIWNSLTGATSYKVKIDNTHNGVTSTSFYTTNTNSITYCAQPGDFISYSVKGLCSNLGEGISSNAFNYTFNAVNGIPTNLTATLNNPPNSSYGYYLNFNPVLGVQDYMLEWFDVTLNTTTIRTSILYTSTNSYYFYYLNAGHTYKYRVAVKTDCGNGTFSSWSSNLLPPPASCFSGPYGSTLLQTKGCGSSSICNYTSLSWPSIAGATQYQIEYVIFNTSANLNLPAQTVVVTSPFASVYYNSLSPQTGWSIHYRVKASCNGTFGNYSEWSPNYFLQ